MSGDMQLIYEAYLNQSGMAYDQARKKQIPGLTPGRGPSYARRTAELPAGGAKVGVAGMGSSGISIDNEEVANVKGVGNMSRNQIEKMITTLTAEIASLSVMKNFHAIESKIETLQELMKYIR